MSTLGKTSIGGSTSSTGANFTFGMGSYTAPGSGAVSQIQFYGQADSSGHLTFGVYDNTGAAGEPGALLATSSQVVFPASAGWVTASLSLSLVSGSTYWLAICSDVGFTYYYDTSGLTSTYKAHTYAAGSLQDPYGTKDGEFATQEWSAYLTYGAGGGGGGTNLFYRRRR